MRTQPMTCPWLKQVVMLYCDACPQKKMVPLDHLVPGSPCLLESWEECSIYKEAVLKLGAGSIAVEPPDETGRSRREVPQ